MTNTSLEKTMVRYQDLLTVRIRESNESCIRLPNSVPNRYDKRFIEMEQLFGKRIVVRKQVASLLTQAQQALTRHNPEYSLLVTFGYRTIKIQTERFLAQLIKEATKKFWENPMDLYERVHRFVAVPTVAGHPTGGAVDITITTHNGAQLDFGSSMYDYATDACYTFFPTLSTIQKENRLFLRNLMTSVGFAPYDGEWWHFSYGDREWSYYYSKPFAIYDQIPDNLDGKTK